MLQASIAKASNEGTDVIAITPENLENLIEVLRFNRLGQLGRPQTSITFILA
jgi:hypothetical protein